MSLTVSIEGFRPPDETWLKHKAVWDACKAAGVDVPQATVAFFGDTWPEDRGIVVSQEALESFGAVREWQHENSPVSGYEVVLEKLPKTITVLRFVVSR